MHKQMQQDDPPKILSGSTQYILDGHLCKAVHFNQWLVALMYSESSAVWGTASRFLGYTMCGFKQNPNVSPEPWVTAAIYLQLLLPRDQSRCPDCASQNHFLSPPGGDPLCWWSGSCRTILWLFTWRTENAGSKALPKTTGHSAPAEQLRLSGCTILYYLHTSD